MKQSIYLLLVIALCACNGSTQEGAPTMDTTQTDIIDTVSAPVREYANARFREVRVERSGMNRYTATGRGQIFEASFGWVVEDGHNELAQGHAMTDAGAPEWGSFRFDFQVERQRPNSTLTLILFEVSAKDGSRQHELPIALP